MRCFVTGGAGFIGSNLTERLLKEGHEVTVYDNLTLGSMQNLVACKQSPRFQFIQSDLLDLETLIRVVPGHDVVFHMAANSDIPAGRLYTDTDLRQGTLATYNVLTAMRQTGIDKVVFASTSAIYGEAVITPTPEDYGPLLPISLYGASKLACEGLISAFCHNYGMQAWIFRFANICGRHGTHGIIIDFISKLQKNPRLLEVLGNGQQAKPYLHVAECVDGILFGWKNSQDELNLYNLSCEGATSVDEITKFLLEAMNASTRVEIKYTGGTRGWPGDVSQVRLDCTKMKSIGWQASLSSNDAVRRAVTELIEETACKS